jgi:hypothetical protein
VLQHGEEDERIGVVADQGHSVGLWLIICLHLVMVMTMHLESGLKRPSKDYQGLIQGSTNNMNE